MEEYERLCELAAKLDVKDFTDLQWKVFSDAKFYDLSKWLFVLGATSSGKTLVALLAYFVIRERQVQKGLPYKMLFAVPYRALAAQKTAEIFAATKALGLSLKIFQSTSEYLVDDEKIFKGEADIVIIINEKIFMFAGNDSAFLERYDLLVLDEIGLVDDEFRGVKTDFILLHARRKKNLRVIVLGTPFYLWQKYLEKFDFVLFREDERPIKLLELPITYDDNKICEVADDCQAVSLKDFAESEFFLDDKIQSKPGEIHLLKIIAEVCRHHLQRSERILIFINNREDVRKFSRMMSRELARKGILKARMNLKACREYIKQKIQADNDDILFGIMNDDDYFSFACGVSYHNANMFSNLRSVIEEDFLSENGRLQIVFSTETLAYGINSNADVVIIPRLEKLRYDSIANARNDGKLGRRFLYPNEYMNYCGRAGRLNARHSANEQKKIGWVYPFICANHFKKNSERTAWSELQEKVHSPENIASKFFEADPISKDFRPLYLLNLFSMFENKKQGATLEDIEEIIEQLPGSPSALSEEEVKQPLEKLLERNLIYETDDEDDDWPRYKLSDIGRNLAGFVISIDNYDRLLSEICEYVTAEDFFVVDMFASIVSSSEILRAAKANLGELSYKNKDGNFLQRAVSEMKIIFFSFQQKTTARLYRCLINDVDKFKWLLDKNKAVEVYGDENFKQYRILASILLWYRGRNCSPRRLYDGFKIYYETLHRMVESVSYRVEIMRFALPLAPAREKGQTLRQSLGVERTDEIAERMTRIINKMMYYPSKEFCDFLGISHCDLYKAQCLWKVERLYKLLCSPEKTPETLEEIKLLAKESEKWTPSWREAFKKNFGGKMF